MGRQPRRDRLIDAHTVVITAISAAIPAFVAAIVLILLFTATWTVASSFITDRQLRS